MKMNKLILLLSALVLGAFVLTACGGNAAEVVEDAVEVVEEAAEEVVEEAAEVVEDAAEAVEEAAEEVVEEAAEVVEDAAAEEEMEEMADAVELRFAYYGDGGEPDAMQALIDKFEAANEGITVELDVVPYETIDTQLPVQVDTGEGPDMARITNFGFYSGRLLDMTDHMANPGYLRDNFPGPVMDAMGDAGGVYGFPDGFTVTGPYVNKTLFDQAEVEMPGADAGWAEWTEAATAVAEATGVQYAISIDRTGHRFAGPAMSSGAVLIDADGNFTVDTEGFRTFAEQLNGWHVDGVTPSEVWLVGDSVNSCMDFFKSGELVMCMSGSWQINGLAADVGDAFDWVVAPNPGGENGTGVAGGSAVVAIGDTEYPAEVSMFMEFIAQAENYGEFSASTLLLPAQTEVASNGVDFATEDAQVLAALGAFTSEIPRLQDQAVQLNVHPYAFAYYRNSANRIGQYIAGELSLDDALAGLQEDIDDAIAEANAGAEEDAAAPLAALEPAELRFAYYGDGGEPDAMQALIDKFEAANPGVTVELDVVPYDTIDTQLPVQVDTGEGPDMARITNFGFYSGRLLDMTDHMANPGYLRDNFPGPVMDAMGDAGGVYGFPDGFTVTGPYVNKTLFDQAEVEMPGADAGWAEWADAAQAVAEATGVQYAISVDRTGHRFAGPAMSSGATLIDGDGNFTVDTEGFRAFAEELNSWHVDGITPSEVWLVGDSVNSCIDAFKSGELVMCMSGSWQINGLAADVGDAFDWIVAPNPGGDSGTGVAGGSAVVAIGDTEYPVQVSAFMEFIAQAENYSEFSASTLLLPAQTEVASNGVDFATEDAQVLAALGAFTSEIPRLQDQAVQLNVHPFAFAYYRNSANRIGQYIAGELSLDDALAGLQEDIDDAIAEASTIVVDPDSIGGENNPIEVLFVPSVEADVIVTGGEVMAEALNAATGLSFNVSVPTSYAATIEAICASPENTLAFIPALGYVLANNRCDVEVGAAAVRFGLSWYASQIVVAADSDIESIDDLNGKTWAVPDLGSTSGFLYPSVMFEEAGVEAGEIVEAGGHSQAMLAVYNGEVDFATAYFSPPLTDPSWAYGDAPEPYDKTTCARNDEGRTFCGDVRALDARSSVTDTAADIFEATRIVMLSPQIPNDTMSFSPEFPEELKSSIVDAMVEFAASDACQASICSDDFYSWSGLDPVADSFYDPVRGLIDALGYTDEDIFGG